MDNNVSGDNNVSIGFNCIKSNTSGSNNICIGNNSLTENKSGNNNIYIGGDTSSNEPENQLAIGITSKCPSDNTIYLGSSTNTPAIYTNFILDIRMIPTYNNDIDASNNGVKLGGLYKNSQSGITYLCINSIDS